jgi:myo-inositol-1(or 4)-monophosphatase
MVALLEDRMAARVCILVPRGISGKREGGLSNAILCARPRTYNDAFHWQALKAHAYVMSELNRFVAVAEQAARVGGQVLQDWKGRFQIREKGPADLVTDADEASQEAVRRTILSAFGDHDVLAEEDRALQERRSEYRWIVDPLDGTTNYVHGVPHYAVSVALEHGGELLAGAVYDPSAKECFVAARGAGSRLNGKPMRASDTTSLAAALVAVSFPPLVEPGSRSLEDFLKVIVRSRAVRRTGSAALNLCYVAAGRFDAYSARETRAWDVAAGALLVQEAGGTIVGIDGLPFTFEKPQFIATGTRALNETLMELIGDRR